jgi:hypothetical protein
MPRPRCYRCWLAAALLAPLLCIPAAAAHAQFDYRAGSMIEPLPGPPTVGAEVLPAPAYATSPALAWNGNAGPPPEFLYHVGGAGRGYFINDQRIEFTGMEDTFAVEGVLDGGITQHTGNWQVSLEAELFLNQTFGKNIYVNTPERASFAANFDIDPLQVSQLYLAARNDDFYAALGRFVTPFGRFYFPNYRNNFDDSPFIRSEAILFRETGALVQWDPSIWVFTAALTNGSFEQDTNSSKAIVARAGIDQPGYALGTSVKWQDGIGSETQKIYNNHVGVDAMVRFGCWTLSGEAIYDEYGLRRPGTLLNDITWGRSLYYRDLNNGYHIPLTGIGYYVNLGYEGPHWSLMLNYGEFYPERIGDPRHDTTTRRGLIKASRHWTQHFETYGIVLLENDLPGAFDSSTRKGPYFIIGGQFAW